MNYFIRTRYLCGSSHATLSDGCWSLIGIFLQVDHLETSFKLLCSDKFSHCSVSFPLTPELEETAQPKSSPVMFSLYMVMITYFFCFA